MSKLAIAFSLLLGGVIFTSCASAPNVGGEAILDSSQEAPAATPAQEAAKTTQLPRQRPQLIKRASMTVVVESLEKSINTVSQIIEKRQGDLISLEQEQPKNNDPHTARIQLRIPQNQLEATLNELSQLGTTESRNITAEDVSSQLVDFQARLANLRLTETNLQKIMARAGSVRDTLSVANELSQVRESIEQINAQLKNLQNQVAYSTITLNLRATTTTNQGPALSSQVQETWNKSTRSLGDFSVGLLKLGIWLLVYSPYLLILALCVYGINRWLRRKTVQSINKDIS
jgi:hypothetical protein